MEQNLENKIRIILILILKDIGEFLYDLLSDFLHKKNQRPFKVPVKTWKLGCV